MVFGLALARVPWLGLKAKNEPSASSSQEFLGSA